VLGTPPEGLTVGAVPRAGSANPLGVSPSVKPSGFYLKTG
jgi:hypothetical protein